jgi:putative GTP pyrophosphokinase
VDEAQFTPDEVACVEDLMAFHIGNRRVMDYVRKSLIGLIDDAPELGDLIHSYKVRAKDDLSMKTKLFRKIEKSRNGGPAFDINRDNFYDKINDAIGVRLIHLSVTQFPEIHAAIRELIKIAELEYLEPAKAEVFDAETQAYFQGLGLCVHINERLYSSVHYILGPAKEHKTFSVELQVRTIAQEVWGEVDHRFNYPFPHADISCREQIKTLAHQMNAAARAVTTIFRTVEEHNRRISGL